MTMNLESTKTGVRAALAALLVLTALGSAVAQEKDAEGLPDAADLRAGQDEHKRYFLIGPRAEGDKEPAAPKRGYKLLLVLPGGSGSADFKDFVRRIALHATGTDYIVAQLVAPVWFEGQGDECVWPTDKSRVKKMKFTTEEFIDAVIDDVESRHRIDPNFIFTMSWSSSGPAAYAASLTKGTRITGSFIAMSVFKPNELPKLRAAKGKAYSLLHSPDDWIPIKMARTAKKRLEKAKAKVELKEYAGGHGWRGNVYGMMRSAFRWLEKNHAKAPKRKASSRRKAPQKKPAEKKPAEKADKKAAGG